VWKRHLPEKVWLLFRKILCKIGRREEKYFETLPEAKNWLADARYEDRHNMIVISPDMTNDIIAKHPMDGVRYTKPVRAVDDIKFLTIGDQEKFLETAKQSHNCRQYALLLETGLRTAELIDLTWDAIDWKKHTLTVNKSLEYRHERGYWRAGPPKTKKSYRIVPFRSQIVLRKSSKTVMMKRIAVKNLNSCHRFWNTQTAGREKRNILPCMIWFSRIGARENRQRTAPMTHIFISCVSRQESRDFVCMLFGTPTQPAPLSVGYSLKSCSSF